MHGGNVLVSDALGNLVNARRLSLGLGVIICSFPNLEGSPDVNFQQEPISAWRLIAASTGARARRCRKGSACVQVTCLGAFATGRGNSLRVTAW